MSFESPEEEKITKKSNMIENNQNACHPGHSPYILRKGITVVVNIFIVQVNHVI